MDLHKSKKFQMAIVGIVIVITSHYGLELDEGSLTKIIGIIIAYIAGQGLADFGKEARK